MRVVAPAWLGTELVVSGLFTDTEVAVGELTEVIVLVTVDTVKVVWMLVLPRVVTVFVTGQVVT